MRITSFEQEIIKSRVRKHFGMNADVYIFGSRVDNNRKGGDIDLYITTDMPASEIIREKISLLVELENALGEQKIDVVINNRTKRKPIDEIEHIDQMVYRFSKLQDSIGERLFKSLLMFLEEDVTNKPFLDILNRLEQLEILPSKDEWLKLRKVRNELSHEYSNED